MLKLEEEGAELKDGELAGRVSPKIVRLAFFGKADLNADEESLTTVMAKLKRFATNAEKHKFVLRFESLLGEADHAATSPTDSPIN